MSVTALLSAALEAHDIPHRVTQDLVEVGTQLTFRPSVFHKPARQGQVLVRLTIATTAPRLGPATLLNSFASLGDDLAEAEQDAFEKFLLGAFHVILGTLAGHRCEADGTEWHTWQGVSGTWRICDSALLVQGAAPDSVAFDGFFPVLESLFVQHASTGLHWCETFFASVNGAPVAAEVNLDNEVWAAATDALERWHTDLPPGYRSGRHFFIAMPAV